ncbi:hypothetical protein B0H19DRAFT_1219035 [Mycena capillaripes]|nr:hypothetical protein B0H19DRAFT_1219035 [Mycena capillaripes]
MSLPPVPPRPPTVNPPISEFESPPHFENPLVAPRPHRVDPSLGANMARDLDNTMNNQQAQLNPGFIQPHLTAGRTPSPLPSQGNDWSPWAVGGASARTPSPMPPARLPSPPRDGSLTVPLPSVAALTAALPTVTLPSHDPQLQLAWARDVLFLANLPEAMYLRATFAASGQYPNILPANPRAAFRDFEAAARAGHAPAWFRLARDYEAFSDTPHAIDCLNRGAKARDPAALHRLGTAHLLAQLGMQADASAALPYLHQAAVRATLQCPQPAYVFALILLGEFTPAPTPVPAQLLQAYLPQGQTREAYARSMLERAAALHFAPAQYKLGHAFEFAVPASAFPFDPLLSVQWYSLASQAGEAEADMALSKWFLCGAEGAFDKDEALARTFAAKAAAKGLPSGEFAMGYYNEVGIGGGLDLGEARGWYGKAAAHGNTDAGERLRALAQSVPQALSRTEHDALTGDKLVRKRTQARIRSDQERNPHDDGPLPDPYGAGAPGAPDPYGVGGGRATAPPSSYRAQQAPPSAYGQQQQQQQGGDPGQRRTRVMELARKSSLLDAGHYRAASAGGFDYRAGGGPQGQGQGPPPGAGYAGGPGGGQNGYGGGVYGSPPGMGRGGPLPPQQQQQQRMATGPGRESSLPPQQQQRPPTSGPGRQGTPGAGRGYALTDTGSRPGSVAGSIPSTGGGGGGGGGAGGRAAGTPPLRRPGAGTGPAPPAAGAPSAHPGTGPATFAEMGFTGAKAEDKECVIM